MPPQDPENYSLEEMLQRLKRRESADRDELVMRADGSRVMKRRNRRRRSLQPKRRKAPRSSQSARFIKLALGLAVGLLLLLGGFGTLAYVNSSAFVAETEGTLGRLTGGEVRLDKFGVSPLRAQVRAADISWQDGGFLRTGRFENVAAKINLLGFVGGAWGGEELLAGNGFLRFGGSLGTPSPHGTHDARAAGKDGSSPYNFMRYRCARLTAQFGADPAHGPSVVGAEATFYLRNDANQLRLNGGVLTAAGWGSMPLGRSRFLLKNDELDVSLIAHDLVDGRGELGVSGKLDPRSQSAALNVRMVRFPLAHVVGEDLAKLINGRVDSEGMASFDPVDFASLEVLANFKVAPLESVGITSLPVFSKLSREFEEPSLGAPVFQSAEGLVSRSARGCRLSELRLEQRNLVAVNGSMAVDAAGTLSGSLEVGIAERFAALATSPEIIAAFSVRRDGYRWARVILGGTAASPTDSFQLPPAAVVAPQAPESETPAEKLEREFKELIR